MNLSSPNKIICEYFGALQLASRHAEEAKGTDCERQYAAMARMLAMTVIEAFLNAYFRVVVSEPAFSVREQKILAQIGYKSIEEKLKVWPKLVFGNAIDQQSTAFKDFQKLKTRRNDLVHFKSTHQAFQVQPGLVINGLADTTSFHTLTSQDAADAIRTVAEIFGAVFRTRGIPEDELPGMMQGWTGLPYDFTSQTG